jgi:2,4-dienoyl-CoA reductase-like NADH-dependent reductase (Old Yellow Enzyme family)
MSSRLLEPLVAGKLSLHNRLVMPPMATAMAGPNGEMTDDLLGYYDEKSAGGALGLVITEHCYIAMEGRNRVGQPSIADDETIEGWKRFVDVVHRNGSKTVMQINHSGGATSMAATGSQPVGPSDITSPIGPGETPRPLATDEIAIIVGQFASAARRVQEAGFDGVEIHAAHGYLLNQFYSPITNKRSDEYGGDLRGRIHVHVEAIEAVRAAVGESFPVLMRFGAVDYIEGGSRIEDAIAAAPEFERAGINILDITGGLKGYIRPGHDEPGYFGDVSGAMKQVVAVPVILTGGVTESRQAEQLLAEGKADLIGVGRAILKDSDWARRAMRELEAQSG